MSIESDTSADVTSASWTTIGRLPARAALQVLAALPRAPLPSLMSAMHASCWRCRSCVPRAASDVVLSLLARSMPRAMRLATARLPPTLCEVSVVHEWRGSSGGNEVHSALSRKHRGPGAHCGMRPYGRPYVCLRSQDVPTRTLLGPRGDGGGRCARLVACDDCGAHVACGLARDPKQARRFRCRRVCDRWMRAFRLDRERHDTLKARARRTRRSN